MMTPHRLYWRLKISLHFIPKGLENYSSELTLFLVWSRSHRGKETYPLIYLRSPLLPLKGGGQVRRIRHSPFVLPQGTEQPVALCNKLGYSSLSYSYMNFQYSIKLFWQLCRFDAIICKLLVCPIEIITNKAYLGVGKEEGEWEWNFPLEPGSIIAVDQQLDLQNFQTEKRGCPVSSGRMQVLWGVRGSSGKLGGREPPALYSVIRKTVNTCLETTLGKEMVKEPSSVLAVCDKKMNFQAFCWQSHRERTWQVSPESRMIMISGS